MTFSRTFLIAAYVTFTATATAIAGVITEDAVFETGGQSIWQPGTAAFDFKDDLFLGASWGANRISTPSIPVALCCSISAAARLNPGRLGLDLNWQATSGSVDVKFPVQLTYSLPDFGSAGSTVSIDTNFAAKNTPLLTTLGPTLKAELDLVANLGGGVSATLHTPPFVPNVTVSKNFSTGALSVPLVSIGGGVTQYKLANIADVVNITANQPDPLNLSTTQLLPGNRLIAGGSAGPPLLSADIDLVKLLGLAFPPLKLLSNDIGLARVIKLEYDILKGEIQTGINFRQDFEFDVNDLDVILTANTGQVRTGKIGESFDFVFPDSGDLVIDSAVTLDNTFINKTGLDVGSRLEVKVLDGELDLGNLTLLEFGPLFDFKQNLFEGFPIEKSDTFSLVGFNEITDELRIRTSGTGMVMAPEPSTLVLVLCGLIVIAFLRMRVVENTLASNPPLVLGGWMFLHGTKGRGQKANFAVYELKLNGAANCAIEVALRRCTVSGLNGRLSE